MIINQRRTNQLLRRIESRELHDVITICLNYAIQYTNGGGRSVQSQLEKVFTDRVQKRIEAPAEEFKPRTEAEILEEIQETVVEFTRSGSEVIVAFERLELENFKAFLGKHEVNLEAVPERPVIVFVGENGVGKSTVFEALNIALYGESYVLAANSEINPPGIDFINDEVYDEATSYGLAAEASVTLDFRVAEKRYRIKRTLISSTIKGDDLPAAVRTDFVEIKAPGNHQKMNAAAIGTVLRYMPESVREFFLFDGERSSEFTSTADPESGQRAMQDALGISFLESLVEDANNAKNNLGRQVNRKLRSQEQNQGLIEAVEKSDVEINELEQKIQGVEQNIQENRKSIQQIDSTLQANQETRDRQEQRFRLQQLFEDAQKNEDIKLLNIKSTLPTIAQQLGVRAVSQLSEHLAELTNSGGLAGGIHQKFVDDLLDSEMCICGRPLSEHDESERDALHQLIDSLRLQDRSNQNLTTLAFNLRLFRDEVLPHRTTELNELIADYDRARNDRSNAFHELDALNKQLAVDASFNAEGFEQLRSDLQSDNDQLIERLGGLKEQLRKLEGRRKALQDQIDESSEYDEETERLRGARDWADITHSFLQGFVKELSLVLRLEAGIRTEYLWHRMLPNVDRYRVLIRDDYTIDVLAPSGERALGRLSGGQSQCLGLAFIASISHAANTVPPLTIDNPFGRLSDKVAMEVAEALPELTNQLILFQVAGEQWAENVQNKLHGKIMRVTEIIQDDQNVSRFVEGGLV